MNHPYLPVLIFLSIALALPIGALALAHLSMAVFTPLKHSSKKSAPYECRVESFAERQTRFNSQYYLFGLLDWRAPQCLRPVVVHES